MARNLTNNHCKWDGCNVRTMSRLDGVTPLKYCPAHKKLAQEAWSAKLDEQAAEKAQRAEIFRGILEAARTEGEKAAEAAQSLSSPVSRTIVFTRNRKFSNFLVRDGVGVDTPQGVIVPLPASKGSTEYAQAVVEFLAPLTATGQPLEGQRITVR